MRAESGGVPPGLLDPDCSGLLSGVSLWILDALRCWREMLHDSVDWGGGKEKENEKEEEEEEEEDPR